METSHQILSAISLVFHMFRGKLLFCNCGMRFIDTGSAENFQARESVLIKLLAESKTLTDVFFWWSWKNRHDLPKETVIKISGIKSFQWFKGPSKLFLQILIMEIFEAFTSLHTCTTALRCHLWTKTPWWHCHLVLAGWHRRVVPHPFQLHPKPLWQALEQK